MKVKQQIGIWIDKRKAILISVQQNESSIYATIESEVDEFHPVGGARSKVAWGPMDSVSEGKFLEREKHQLKRFFGNIADRIDQDTEVYIFGPSETKIGLKKFFENLSSKTIHVVHFTNADSMTPNQMKAQVRNFFKS